MRYHILEKIEAEDPLAVVFNAYMARLSLFEISLIPCGNMREFNRLFHGWYPGKRSKRERQQAQLLLTTIPQFYQLQLLSDSLNSLHRCVSNAIEHLAEFFDQYAGDLTRYASAKRMASIEADGSNDDSDWYRDDEADESEEWKVVYKDDAASLAAYTLQDTLSHCFVGGEFRGEHIGSSQVEDFAHYTALVARHADLDPFKKIAEFTGHEVPVYRQNEQGELVRQSLADQTENYLNDELKSVRTAAWFTQLLHKLQFAAGLYILLTDAASYRELLGVLVEIRDGVGLVEPAGPLND